jgi:hypothetical protein
MSRRIVYSTLLVTLLTACSSQEAADTAAIPAPTPTEATADGDQPGQAGVKVFVDPATGEIREPTPADIAALEAEQRKATVAKPQGTRSSQTIVHPDGTVEVVLDGSHDQSVQGCVQPDGGIKTDHVCDTDNSGQKK